MDQPGLAAWCMLFSGQCVSLLQTLTSTSAFQTSRKLKGTSGMHCNQGGNGGVGQPWGMVSSSSTELECGTKLNQVAGTLNHSHGHGPSKLQSKGKTAKNGIKAGPTWLLTHLLAQGCPLRAGQGSRVRLARLAGLHSCACWQVAVRAEYAPAPPQQPCACSFLHW